MGNFRKKSDYSTNVNGAYQYTNGTNQLASVSLKGGGTATFSYDDKGNLTHRNGKLESTYNAFNKPTRIAKNDTIISLSYGADLSRYQQVRVVDNKTITTHYIGKLYEVETKDGNATSRMYISDVAIIKQSNTDKSIRFTHRDRLGSASTFTDHNAQVTAYRSYDPFGAPKGGNWRPLLTKTLLASDSDMATRRGFTDHEHLDEAELIHMNGRVYDYNVGRFLSVDPFVHEGSQGINPYSYIMNNPLAGTDPTGYEPEKVSKVVKVAVAGSRIKRKVNVTAQSNGSGGASVTITGSDSAAVSNVKNSISNSASEAGSSVADIGSQNNISKNQNGSNASASGNDSDDSFTVSDGGIFVTPNHPGATAKFTDITTNDEGVVTNATITCNLSCQKESLDILHGRDFANADLFMTSMRMNMQNAHSQASEALKWVFSPVGATYGGFALRSGYQATAVGLKNLGSAKRQVLFSLNIEIASIINGAYHPINIMKSMVPHSQVIQSASFRHGASASKVLGKPRIRRFIKGPGKPKIRPENMGN